MEVIQYPTFPGIKGNDLPEKHGYKENSTDSDVCKPSKFGVKKRNFINIFSDLIIKNFIQS